MHQMKYTAYLKAMAIGDRIIFPISKDEAERRKQTNKLGIMARQANIKITTQVMNLVNDCFVLVERLPND